MRRSYEALPQGEEKVRAVRTMFDAIAPRYDLVNRLMTFRIDVRLAKARRSLARLGPRSARRRPRVGYRRSLRRAGQSGLPTAVVRLVVRHAHRRPQRRAPRARPTSCGSRSRDGVARRRHVRLRPAQPRRPRFLLRRTGAGRAAGRAHRAARRGRRRQTPSCAGATSIYFGRSCHESAGCCSATAPRTATCLSRVAYLPPPADMLDRLARGRLHDVAAPPALGRHHPTLTATRS